MLGRRAVVPLGAGTGGGFGDGSGRGFDSWLLLARADGFALGGILVAILANSERIAQRVVAYRRAFTSVIIVALAIVIIAMVSGELPSIRKAAKGLPSRFWRLTWCSPGLSDWWSFTREGRSSPGCGGRGWFISGKLVTAYTFTVSSFWCWPEICSSHSMGTDAPR